jgi:hypothetical protein
MKVGPALRKRAARGAQIQNCGNFAWLMWLLHLPRVGERFVSFSVG